MRRQKAPKWLLAAKAANKGTDSEKAGSEFLSRALARAGLAALSEAERMIRESRVAVNGRIAREPFAPWTANDVITIDGKRVDVRPSTRVLAFHKPAGLVVNGSDRDGDGTVFDYLRARLPAELQGYEWLAVGRLDRDTTGLLLMTNDERFVGFATSPETHLPKRYVVRVAGQVTEEKLQRLRNGVTWDGITSKPAKAELREPSVLELTLTEGKFHQVKRMLNEVHLGTLSLHRDQIGSYTLDVREGEWRELNADEIQQSLRYTPRS